MFLGFWGKGAVQKVIAYKMLSDGFKIRQDFGDNSVSISGATELKVVLDHRFQLLLQLNEIDTRRQDYRGRPTCLSRNHLFSKI
jgi:hypothetical protein